MIVIGLMGGIGSGKSTVLRFLAELGAVVLDGDVVGHEVYQPHTKAWREMVAAFGEDILKDNGEIDRKRLGMKVFSDPQALARLDQIMHPRIFEVIMKRVEEWREQGVEVVVVEIAVPFEAGLTSPVDEMWATIAPEDIVVQRLNETRGLSEAEVRARIRSQPSREEVVRRADVVIDNSGDSAELKAKVEEQWRQLHLRHRGESVT